PVGTCPKTVLGECDEYGAAVFPTDPVPHRCDSKPVFSGKHRSVGTPKGHYSVRGDGYRRAGRGALPSAAGQAAPGREMPMNENPALLPTEWVNSSELGPFRVLSAGNRERLAGSRGRQ